MFFRRRKPERRKFKRTEAEEHRVVDCICSGSRFKAKVIDISEEGMKIDIEAPLRINQEIEFLITRENRKEEKRRAKVIWFIWKSHAGESRAGLKFIFSAADWIEKGRRLYRSGDYQEAIHACTQAIDLNPTYAQAYFSRGAAHQKMRNYEEALNDLKAAARLGLKKAQDLLNSRGIS